jgi:hypothetical protein
MTPNSAYAILEATNSALLSLNGGRTSRFQGNLFFERVVRHVQFRCDRLGDKHRNSEVLHSGGIVSTLVSNAVDTSSFVAVGDGDSFLVQLYNGAEFDLDVINAETGHHEPVAQQLQQLFSHGLSGRRARGVPGVRNLAEQ